jgi:hypothetical protein
MPTAGRRPSVHIIGDGRAFLNHRIQRCRSRGRFTITKVGCDIAYPAASEWIGAFLNVLEKPDGARGPKWPLASCSQLS